MYTLVTTALTVSLHCRGHIIDIVRLVGLHVIYL